MDRRRWRDLKFFPLFRVIPSAPYLKLLYRVRTGKKLDLKHPKTFNEKLQWLKLYDHRPEYPALVDKARVKDIIAKRIGEQYIIPTLGIWDRAEEIDFDSLPDRFVLKCTHDSGSILVCRDKASFDREKAKASLRKSLKTDWYWPGREWAYKSVKPRILAEAYLEPEDLTEGLRDFKFMCFDGRVAFSSTATRRFDPNGMCLTFHDRDWNRLPFERDHPAEKELLPRPECYDDMVRVAEELSRGMPFARVDLYQEKGRVYFGEITLYPANGTAQFQPEEWDLKWGELLKLDGVRTQD